MNKQIADNISFYKYLSNKLMNLKVDMFIKTMMIDPDTLDKKTDNASEVYHEFEKAAPVLAALESLARYASDSFRSFMVDIGLGDSAIGIYSEMMESAEKCISNEKDPTVSAQYELLKKILNDAYEEWKVMEHGTAK